MEQPMLFNVDVPPDPLVDAWRSTPEPDGLRYPVYIPSLRRAGTATTQAFLPEFRFVVEQADYGDYVARFRKEHVLSLPGDGYGGPAYVRNWIKDHARAEGHARHWQLDDNIRKVQRHERVDDPREGRDRRSTYHDARAEAALGRVERFVDDLDGVGIVGLCHQAFAWTKEDPFQVNQGVYSCVLVADDDLRWRVGVIEDTDYSLQTLAAGQCTILFAEYIIYKAKTQSMAGGNTDNIYRGDGRLRNIKGMQQAWPHLEIGMTERFGKPVAQTGHVWRKFTHKPRKKEQ